MTVNCPMCASRDVALKWAGTGDWSVNADQAFRCTTTARTRPDILRCAGCGHEFSDPATWPTDLGAEYDGIEDDDYLAMVDIKRRTFGRAADILGSHVSPPARVLEVGAYAGLFLAECRTRGYKVVGVEPSAWGARVASEHGLQVHHGTAEEILSSSDLGSFDAVVSWDVLEHVADPRHFLSLMARHVGPGGYLIVSTLDRSNWFARVMGKRWPWLIPMHLHYFDQSTVIALAEAEGLTFVQTKAHVHYTSAGYAARRFIGHGSNVEAAERGSVLDRIVFPVGFGDVRLYVFHRDGTAAQ